MKNCLSWINAFILRKHIKQFWSPIGHKPEWVCYSKHEMENRERGRAATKQNKTKKYQETRHWAWIAYINCNCFDFISTFGFIPFQSNQFSFICAAILLVGSHERKPMWVCVPVWFCITSQLNVRLIFQLWLACMPFLMAFSIHILMNAPISCIWMG